MQIIHSVAALRQALVGQHAVAFVPTMGNLHQGHLALVQLAKQKSPFVVVSIFVNPLQFGPGEDFENYPRTLSADCEALSEVGVDVVFAPSVYEMYPDWDGVQLNQTMTIMPPPIADTLCGATRPGHFVGVATIVMKLFQMVQPTVAVFGKKDYQQLMIIREMVKQFNVPIEIIACDTLREVSGLAMSSRNGYLTTEEKQRATRLYQTLNQVVILLEGGRQDLLRMEQEAESCLEAEGWQVDYIAIRDASTLGLPSTDTQRFVVLGAAKLGKTRLIDNIEFCAKSLN